MPEHKSPDSNTQTNRKQTKVGRTYANKVGLSLNHILERKPSTLNSQQILQLQRTIGNQAVLNLIDTGGSHAVETPIPQITNDVVDRNTIQFKLAGNGQILRDIDDKRKAKSKWRDIVNTISKYEELELKLEKEKREPNAKELANLANMITEMDVKAKQWIVENVIRVESYRVDKDATKAGKKPKELVKLERDDKKLTALKYLRTRLAAEKQLLLSGKAKPNDPSINNPNVYNPVGGGQVSDIGTVEYNPGKEDAKQGFFQSEKTYYDGIENAGFKTGIPQQDPNYGARAIAMNKLDQLLTDKINENIFKKAQGADPAYMSPMLPKSQFATRSTTPNEKTQGDKSTVKQGLFMEKADGSEMRGDLIRQGKTRMPNMEQDQDQHQDTISLDDPVLMRSLNRLQILDALCAQVDRHAGNYFILTDGNGNVLGVQGIDNDMAFGKDIKDPNDPAIKEKIKDKAWRGLPTVVDKEVMEAVLAITPKDITDALNGLLDSDEITSTVQRLSATQQFFRVLPVDRLIKPDDWRAQKAQLYQMAKHETDYLGVAKGETARAKLGPKKIEIGQELNTTLKPIVTEKLPTIEGKYHDDIDFIMNNATSHIASMVDELVASHNLSIAESKQVIEIIGREFINDPGLVDLAKVIKPLHSNRKRPVVIDNVSAFIAGHLGQSIGRVRG